MTYVDDLLPTHRVPTTRVRDRHEVEFLYIPKVGWVWTDHTAHCSGTSPKPTLADIHTDSLKPYKA